MSQVCDVVLVRCIFSSGKPQGVGILEWGVYGEGDGNGEISLRATWTELDRILSQQGGFQVSKGKQKRAKSNKEREKQKARGLLHNCIVHSIFMYIVNACNCLNDCQSIYVRIIIVKYECSY